MKLNIQFAVVLLGFMLLGCSDLSTETQPDPSIGIKFADAETDTVIEQPELYADGQSVIWLKFAIDPVIRQDADRKYKVSTSAGDLIFNGEAKKTHDMNFNGKGNGQILLRSPNVAGPAVVSVITEKGSVQQTASLTFKKALPDHIVLEAPQYSLKDTSVNQITIRLFRDVGFPSINQFLVLKLIDEQNLEVTENASFENTTVSDSAGICKSSLVLRGLKKGKYTIKASIREKNDPGWVLNIEVVPKK